MPFVEGQKWVNELGEGQHTGWTIMISNSCLGVKLPCQEPITKMTCFHGWLELLWMGVLGKPTRKWTNAWTIQEVAINIISKQRNCMYYIQISSYYNFWVYNLLTPRYNSILSSSNSKIIIAKNLEKFRRIATIIWIKSTFSNFLNHCFGRYKKLIFHAQKPHVI